MKYKKEIIYFILLLLLINVFCYKKYYEYFDTDTFHLMICSDIHIEPWYNKNKKYEKTAYRIRRHDNPQISTINYNKSLKDLGYKCDSDPPKDLLKVAISMFTTSTDKEKRKFLFCGDTKAHHIILPNNEYVDFENKIMNDTLDLLLENFNPENIFYVPGNHDGTGDTFFFNPNNDVDSAWANRLIEKKIAPDKDVFKKSGYYKKKLNDNIDVIIMNSMLYGFGDKPSCKPECNETFKLQKDQFEKDLQSAKNNSKKIIIMTHYPIDVFKLNKIEVSNYTDVVIYHFVAHLHQTDINHIDSSLNTEIDKIDIRNIPPLTLMNDKYSSSFIQTTLQNTSDTFDIEKNNVVTINCPDIVNQQTTESNTQPMTQTGTCCAKSGQYIYWKGTWDMNNCEGEYELNNPLTCCDGRYPIYGLNGSLRCP